jgi:hypothetical protein
MDTLFVARRVLIVASSSRFAGLPEISVGQFADEPFVARKAPDKWRDFWLATQARGGQPVASGTQVATVDECFEATLAAFGGVPNLVDSRVHDPQPSANQSN